jgi:phage shock protein A
MGKIDRLKRITSSRIEAFLNSLEKPEYILPRLVEEMNEQIDETVNAQVKALSAVKGARRRLDEASGKVSRLEKGARLAVLSGDMETARQAIAAQIEAERQAECCRKELQQAEIAFQTAKTVCQQLKGNLKELKAKKKDILHHHRRQQLIRRLGRPDAQQETEFSGSLLEAIARMETKVQEQEIQLEVQSELTKSLGVTFNEERVKRLERDAEVDLRLHSIKEQIEKETP